MNLMFEIDEYVGLVAYHSIEYYQVKVYFIGEKLIGLKSWKTGLVEFFDINNICFLNKYGIHKSKLCFSGNKI